MKTNASQSEGKYLRRALDKMRSGSVLIQQNNPKFDRTEYYIVPGHEISESLAAKIKAHPQVTASHDAMFPGLSQTWRLR